LASIDKYPRFEVKLKADRKSPIETKVIDVDEFVDVRGWKAFGQKFNADVVEAKLLEPKVVESPKMEIENSQPSDENTDSEVETTDNEAVTEDSDGQLALF
jgi:topoisomerase IV subunit A